MLLRVQCCALFLLVLVQYSIGQPSLQNRVLKVITYEQPPFMTINASKSGNSRFSGFSVEFLNAIVANINANISYELIMPPDGTLGSFDPVTRTWTGMIGEVVNNRADFLLSGFTINKQRQDYLDFSQSFLDVGLAILVEYKEKDPDMWAFLKPFSRELWFALFGFSLVFSILTWVGDKITPYGKTHERKVTKKLDGEPDEPYSYSEALFSSLLIFIGKDPTSTNSWGLRLIVIAFMFFSVVSTANYTASLASFFTIQKQKDVPIHDLPDLTLKSFGVLRGTNAEQFFQRTKNVLYRRNMRSFPTWPSLLEALENNDIEAAVRDNTLLEFQRNQKPCNKFIVGIPLFDRSNYGIAYPKNTSATDPFLFQAVNNAILSLREDGQIEDLYKSWWNDGLCPRGQPEEDGGLDVTSFTGVFSLVSIVCAIGIIVLAIETGFHRWYSTIENPNIILRSIDTFFGGKNKEQSRELQEQQLQSSKKQNRRPTGVDKEKDKIITLEDGDSLVKKF